MKLKRLLTVFKIVLEVYAITILLNQIVIVDKLYKKLCNLFYAELNNLKIGCQYDKERMRKMMDIINAIDCIHNGHLSRNEIIKTIKHYE
jgi:hypothetical protein